MINNFVSSSYEMLCMVWELGAIVAMYFSFAVGIVSCCDIGGWAGDAGGGVGFAMVFGCSYSGSGGVVASSMIVGVSVICINSFSTGAGGGVSGRFGFGFGFDFLAISCNENVLTWFRNLNISASRGSIAGVAFLFCNWFSVS